MNTCKSCGAEIVWVEMDSGKPMPCDAKPLTVVEVYEVKGKKKGSVVNTGYHMSHFATCPNAEKHRRKGCSRSGFMS